MRVLAGDIGGTKTLLQIAEVTPGRHQIVFEKRYASENHQQFLPLVKAFMEALAEHTDIRPQSACFGVAGPVSGRHAKTTNLPWTLDADELETTLRIARVRLLNDFQAVGYGIEALVPSDFVTLQEGNAQERGVRVVIGAGTGLGHGLLIRQSDHFEVLASEGGHGDFSPTDALQIELLQYLQVRYGRATWERVVSGPGLVNIFNFLRETGKGVESAALRQARHDGDAAAAISRFALSGEDPLAVQALHLFGRLYGAQAGNVALTCLATGGVYVAGGIAPKIIDKLKDGTFIQGFLDKEECMRPLLEALPVNVIINAQVGTIGAAVAASRAVET